MGDTPTGYRKAKVRALSRAAVARAVRKLRAARGTTARPRPAAGDCCGVDAAECQVIVSGNTESIVSDTLDVIAALGAGVLVVDAAQQIGVVPTVAGGGYLYDDPINGYGWVP